MEALRTILKDKILFSGGQYESKGALVGSNAAVMSIDFDSTGTLILGASNDFATRVWTVSDHRLRVSTVGEEDLVMVSLSHQKAIKSSAFSLGLNSLYSTLRRHATGSRPSTTCYAVAWGGCADTLRFRHCGKGYFLPPPLSLPPIFGCSG